MKLVVVTQHPAFVEYGRELGIVVGDPVVIDHAVPEQLSGNLVITSGLPLDLASLAHAVVTIPLRLPKELRGTELTIEQMRKYAKPPSTFVVRQLGPDESLN